MDEKKLCKDAANGDVASFEALIKPHQTTIFNIAYRICENRNDAEDIAQDALVKAFCSISEFKGESKFSTWLYRIATNTALDAVKRRKRHMTESLDSKIHTDDGEITLDIPSSEPSPETRAESKEIKIEVQRALNRLPEINRTIIILRDINGLAYNEIAEILGCSEGTVKSRLSRARQKLKEILLKNRELFDG